ncbi:hypothetical protein PtA15_18A72 [Puccinia triticina]|uniref:Uncharacterized protein n=1 Tax=Puccinia triticina TaxID=208348 RepID=A0ABY7D6M5_9BASI|nr:uncharacterized protein PtA15_18A72 [Puccinia triticina]WAQ93016.1 hypothetical protein PtA15_18A72 [Puccinia triticina]
MQQLLQMFPTLAPPAAAQSNSPTVQLRTPSNNTPAPPAPNDHLALTNESLATPIDFPAPPVDPLIPSLDPTPTPQLNNKEDRSEKNTISDSDADNVGSSHGKDAGNGLNVSTSTELPVITNFDDYNFLSGGKLSFLIDCVYISTQCF